MEELRRRIVVGKLFGDCAPGTGSVTETVMALTCRDVLRQLWKVTYVELVIADTDLQLPDGTWKDLVELIVNKRIPGELRIIDRSGLEAFRCTLGPASIPRRE